MESSKKYLGINLRGEQTNEEDLLEVTITEQKRMIGINEGSILLKKENSIFKNIR